MEEDITRFHKIIGQKLGISRTVLERSIILHIAAEKILKLKEKNSDAVGAASIYLVSRTHDTPYTLKELSDACNIPRKDIARCYRLLVRAKDELHLGRMSESQKRKLQISIINRNFFVECPRCFSTSLLYHDTTDVFRCSNCNAVWKRFE